MAFRLVDMEGREVCGRKSWNWKMQKVTTGYNFETDIIELDVMECDLSIKSDLWKCPMKDVRYKPEYISVYELSKLSGIDRSTILKWCKEGKIKYKSGVSGHKPTMIRLYDFTLYVLYKSKLKSMNGVSGKRWSDSEKKNIASTDRSDIAKRVMKCRIKKVNIHDLDFE